MRLGICRSYVFTLLDPAADHEPRHCHRCTGIGSRHGTRVKPPPTEAFRDALQQNLFCAETPPIQGCASCEVADDGVGHLGRSLDIASSAPDGRSGLIERDDWNPALQAHRHAFDRSLCERGAPGDGHHALAERHDAVAPSHSADRRRMHTVPAERCAQCGKLFKRHDHAASARIGGPDVIRMPIAVHACRLGLRHGHADAYAAGHGQPACTYDVLHAALLMHHDDRQTDVHSSGRQRVI
jgi:hypothetical protein